MKKVNFNALDLDPETIGNLTEEQADEVQGGGTSCHDHSCYNAAKAGEIELPTE
jgi:hypothetical protein